jgi:hypothetical protein
MQTLLPMHRFFDVPPTGLYSVHILYVFIQLVLHVGHPTETRLYSRVETWLRVHRWAYRRSYTNNLSMVYPIYPVQRV